MKKNKFLRLASFMLIACLATCCAVGGTFAKYTTGDNATDKARVAKWGVTVTVTGDDAFAMKYNDAADDAGTQVVSTENVVAPGTYGTLATYTIAGTPEVAVNVEKIAALTLTGFGAYCPIVFTVGGETYGLTDINDEAGDPVDHAYATTAELEAAIEGLFNSNTNIGPNVSLAETNEITWEWAFDYNDDVKDTALGDAAATGTAATIEFSLKITVTQRD